MVTTIKKSFRFQNGVLFG